MKITTRKFQHTTWNSQSRIMQHERLVNIRPFWMLTPMQHLEYLVAVGNLPRRTRELSNVSRV